MRLMAALACAFLLVPATSSHAAGKNGRKAPPAQAKKKPYAFSLTPEVGGYVFAGKENLQSAPIYSLVLGYTINGTEMFDSLEIDAVAGYVDTTSKIDGSKAEVYHFRVDALYPFTIKDSRFTPFFSVGGGANLYERNTGSEAKALFSYGAGLKYQVLDYLAARADLRHIILFNPERNSNLEYSAGLTYTFGVERKPEPPVDSDKDGVPDKLDKCPGTPKNVKVDKDGCPKDGDSDGVPDYLDKCQDTPKEVKVNKDGCPAPAKTPEPAKPSEARGSADVGKIAVAPPSASPQGETAAPPSAPVEGEAARPSLGQSELAAITGTGSASAATEEAASGGISLTAIHLVKDGVEMRTNVPAATYSYSRETNPERLVVELPGAGNESGKTEIPLDAPGIARARIETVKGKLRIVLDADRETFPRFRVEKTGSGLKVSFTEATAPQEDLEIVPAPAAPPAGEAAPAPRGTDQDKKEYLLRFTVEFDFNKATIRPKYFRLLRKAANFMKYNPDTVAEIGGHTDSVGKANYNLLLSRRRAGAVREHLIMKHGIDGSRLILRGFGFHSPVADNRTAGGRQKNRRTEVTITIKKSD